jgi:TIR domain
MEGATVAQGPGRGFFISYTQVNRPWAEWIAVQLEAAGYSTVLQAWDFRPRQRLPAPDAAGHHNGGADNRGVVAGLLRV